MVSIGRAVASRWPLVQVRRHVVDADGHVFDELECGHFKSTLWLLAADGLPEGPLVQSRSRRCKFCHYGARGQRVRKPVLPVGVVKLWREGDSAVPFAEK